MNLGCIQTLLPLQQHLLINRVITANIHVLQTSATLSANLTGNLTALDVKQST